MNETRKVVVTVTVLVIAAMALMPPWRGHEYAWVFDPPAPLAAVDFARLGLQAVAALAVGAVCYAFGTDRKASAAGGG